jgi:hypothetical protein
MRTRTAGARARGLVAILIGLLAGAWLGAGSAEAACPDSLRERTIDQVLADLYAARAAGDWEAVGCNYARTAFLIDDQGVLVGRAEIVASLMSWDDLFGGVQAVIIEDNYFENVARVLFTLDGGWVVVEDGVNTYVIRNGKIRRQTTHALIRFTGPPPDSN